MYDIEMRRCKNKATKTTAVPLDNELYGTQYVEVRVCNRCYKILKNYGNLEKR